MHACATEQSTITLCGLEASEVGVTAGYTSLCRTCFPPSREVPWTKESGNRGDRIEGRD